MAKGYVLTRDACGTLPETFLFEDPGDDSVVLSEWGTAFWAKVRPGIYGGRLMEPLSDCLRFSEAFNSQVADRKPSILVNSDKLDTLNQRLDGLARYLDDSQNLTGLDFKKLQGNPKPPCTHEFDVWGDQEYRCFGRYVDKVFVVESIERGFH